MAEGANDNDVGIAGIDDDRIDVADIVKADANPSSAGIGGFVHTVAGSLLAGADVNGTGIRRRECDGADRSDALRVKDRFPYLAAVGGLPNAASRRAHVIGRGVAGDSGDGRNASGAMRTDQSPAHGGVKTGVNHGGTWRVSRSSPEKRIVERTRARP